MQSIRSTPHSPGQGTKRTKRSILVFGATSRMAEMALRIWADTGSSFVLVGRSREKLEVIATDLTTRGGTVLAIESFDLCNVLEHPKLWARCLVAAPQADTVLVAHGILGNQKQEEEDFVKALENITTNFTSAASIVALAANHFEAQQKGSIAVISSVAGDRGRASNYIYGSAKAGLDAFVSGVRNRLSSKGVTVTTIRPGFVATPMTAHLAHGPLFASAETVGAGIVKAVENEATIVYLPWFWRFIMIIICSIPERIFMKLKL